jgi:hypothetical protein
VLRQRLTYIVVSRRIEIELTSQLSPEEWTWRAAGAKLPKGTLPSSILYPGAKAGDIARAEADFGIDGITILEVLAPKGKRGQAAPTNLLEVVGPKREDKLVTSQLVDRKERSGRKGPRRDRGERRDGNEGPGRSRREGRDERSGRSTRPPRPARPETPTFKRLAPKDDARRAVLEELAPEHRPIAEQVLRGGIPAVRQAIEAENVKAKAEGRPELNSEALINMAEELLPKLKAADWTDRANAAKVQVNEISVRDLRAVVSGADAVARTEEARLLAAELREALERRTAEARESWLKDITESLEGGRVVRALRLSARPPDAQIKFPAELLEKLKTETEDSMAPDTPADRWITLLDAVSTSPVRRNVVPKGLPENPSDELLAAAKAAAGRIPALAKQLGVTMPPPPPVRKPIPPKPASGRQNDQTAESSSEGATAN